jgi:Spy/CpxP family protein refolding chaperone
MMNRKNWACTVWTCTVLSCGLLLAVAAARGQDGPPPPPDATMRGGPGGPGGPGPFGDRIELMGFEGLHGNKVVKGAPFSATAATETSQTLQDGTSIHRTTTSTLYRDSLGRSRSEVTLSGFGPLQASGKPHTMISIGDPVAGSRYMLDAENKVAHQMTMKGHGTPSPEQEAAFQQKMQARLQQEEASGAVKKESLGTQTINGVSAEGTRITHTIAAGQIGNDKAIQIVFERWFSPDLQVVVKSTRSDPRFGTTTYTLTNVQRTEPAVALFTVPSDYTLQQGGPRGHERGGVRVPPPDAPVPQ